MKFRYSKKYVDEKIFDGNFWFEKEALLIYLDKLKNKKDYNFYPYRRASIFKIEVLAEAYYFYFKLDDFVSDGTVAHSQWNKYLQNATWKPRPTDENHGKFVKIIEKPELPVISFSKPRGDTSDWKQLVSLLGETNDLKGSVFQRILEIKEIGLLFNRTKNIFPKYLGNLSVYKIPMGGIILLRVLFDQDVPKKTNDFEILEDKEVFLSCSQKVLRLQSRYNVEDVQRVPSPIARRHWRHGRHSTLSTRGCNAPSIQTRR